MTTTLSWREPKEIATRSAGHYHGRSSLTAQALSQLAVVAVRRTGVVVARGKSKLASLTRVRSHSRQEEAARHRFADEARVAKAREEAKAERQKKDREEAERRRIGDEARVARAREEAKAARVKKKQEARAARTERKTAATSKKRWLALAAVALLAIAVPTAVFVWSHRRPTSTNGGKSGPGQSSTVVGPPSLVSIDIRPWARVRIVGLGSAKPPDRTEPYVTPFVVSLPPGKYRLDCENGGLTSTGAFEIAVSTGQPQTVNQLMPGFDINQVVNKLLGPGK
jgi:hypothetical protein